MSEPVEAPSRRPPPPWFAALGLTLGLAALAVGAGALGAEAIEPEHRITTSAADPDERFEAFDAATIAAVDLDGDGTRELVAHNDNNRLYVFTHDGRLAAELETPHPDGWEVRELAGPAVGDLDRDGRPDVVATNSAGWVTNFEIRPGEGDPFGVERRWETYLDPSEGADREWGRPGLDGPAFLADGRGDGRQEVFVQLDDVPSVYQLAANGTVAEHREHSDGNAGPLVADVTDDGRLEAVFATDGGDVRVLDAATMDWRCEFSTRAHGTHPGSISVSPTLADLTGDGRLEIVFGARNVVDDRETGWRERSDAHLYAVDADCQLVWKRTWTWNNPHVHMQPVPVDVTGNGHLDVVFQDWNTIGHEPGNWSHTGPSNLFAIQGHSGQLLWRAELPSYWSNKNVAVGDVTGDGEPEILANGFREEDGVALFTLAGEPAGFLPAPDEWTVSRGPAIADLEGDGRREIVLPIHRPADGCERELDVGCREGALQVYRTAGTDPAVYPNVHRLSAGEVAYRPSSDGLARNATPFAADVGNLRGNAWWVEANVTATTDDATVAEVEVRVDAGPWRNTSRTAWGTWAKSLPAPEGATVQLQAKDEHGHPELSACYAWPEAEPTTCPGEVDEPEPPPVGGPEPLDASFATPRGNAWWIETDVDTDRRLAGVEVRVDGGSWTSLGRTAWGSWARTLDVPEGSVVQFLARTPDGAQARSDCYRWPDAWEVPCPGEGGEGVRIVDVRGNAWWIEAEVEARTGIAAVEARLDGSWASLGRTPWGTWARNAHVSNGSEVAFRVTGASGDVVAFETRAWPPD